MLYDWNEGYTEEDLNSLIEENSIDTSRVSLVMDTVTNVKSFPSVDYLEVKVNLDSTEINLLTAIQISKLNDLIKLNHKDVLIDVIFTSKLDDLTLDEKFNLFKLFSSYITRPTCTRTFIISSSEICSRLELTSAFTEYEKFMQSLTIEKDISWSKEIGCQLLAAI